MARTATLVSILFVSILFPKAIIVAKAQTVSTEKTAVGPTPRTPEGKVDFSGVWDPGLSFTNLGTGSASALGG